MMTKFLCVKPNSKADQVSIGFFVSFMVLFILVNIFISFGILWIFSMLMSVVVSYMLFGGDQMSSSRKLTYQLRNQTLTPNHNDTFYMREAYYRVESLKGIVILEGDEKPENPDDL